MSRPGLNKSAALTTKAYFAEAPKVDTTARALVLPLVDRRPRLKKTEQDHISRKQEVFDLAHKAGFEQGFQNGLTEGRSKGANDAYLAASEAAATARKAELEAFAASLQKTLDSANEAMGRWFELAEEALLEVAIEISKTILAEELKISRGSALAIVKQAMNEITHASTARIRVNPIDSPLMKSFIDEIKACAPSVRQIQIVDDPTMAGGCVIETEGGLIDARIESKISAIEEGLKKAA